MILLDYICLVKGLHNDFMQESRMSYILKREERGKREDKKEK